jgi:uncharacterized membrane protein
VLDNNGRLVRFDRDIAPILRDKCLECHGPEDAKNDFRVDDVDSLMSYVEPEDVAASSLFTDYLVTDDEEMRMPPTSKRGPLAAGELALIKTWIEEGAVWPEGFALVAAIEETVPAPIAEVVEPPAGLIGRVWAFQGYLHPAAVHFPIALLSIGGLFVLLGMKWPAIGTQVPLACLFIGAPAAIGTTLMGWSFAVEQGYGGWASFDTTKEVFWHRWSGVIVMILASVTALIALIDVRTGRESLTKVWKSGLLVCAMLVGLVGHQGGELTYGETFYQRAFDRLFPPPAKSVAEQLQSPAPGTFAVANEVSSAR